VAKPKLKAYSCESESFQCHVLLALGLSHSKHVSGDSSWEMTETFKYVGDTVDCISKHNKLGKELYLPSNTSV